ncbi:hypoxanthine-guanine phosphoribosyltransferase [Trichlorobacter ammonificans]|uniref:Hypoxanthine-guanine phosphoribosyltransferase n=1 Tax=Trichlorobacter ammonificans TaxID=2916410 RepID=A0ABM9D9F2_9BACT|nr:hypoxanthine-guanine phosphoribosyltransferase [Trichlorobacter ammonificans]CAH2031854.1 Hypoxanthine-guanine phosphoribosyltransferase [Trichlorobacter ammonificans]
MDRTEALRVFEEADCLADRQAVGEAIGRMAEGITARIGKLNPVIFCVMNGGLIVTGQLLPLLPFPLETGYLHATRYGRELTGGDLEWLVPPRLDLVGRTVLLVDDILDEGVTLKALTDECLNRGAREVLTAVLVEKQHDRKIVPGYRADFAGLAIPDRFVFGYGLDYDGIWRNAPGIYAVKGL